MSASPIPTRFTPLRARLVLLLIVSATTLAVLQAAAPAPSPGQALPADRVDAFVGARVIADPRSAPIANAVILVRGGKIEAVGPRGKVEIPGGAARHDVSGRTIIPGLVNTHGHVGESRGMEAGPQFYTRDNVLAQLRLYARYGITTVYSLGGDREDGIKVRDEQDVPGLGRARLFVAGPAIRSGTLETARPLVEQATAMKVDIVKIGVDDNLGTAKKMAPEVYGVLIEDAHKKGLRVAAHMYYLEDARQLLAFGIDFLAHSIRDREVDADLIAKLKQRQVCVCPTLMREVSTFVYESTPDFFSDPFFTRDANVVVVESFRNPTRQESFRTSASAQQYKKSLEMASRNLKVLSDAGVPIAFGTDSGPVGRFQGYFEHRELELMVKAGMTPAQALISATSGAADCMKKTGTIGTIAPGAWADFIVLQKNPLDDIRNTRTIESVWIGGGMVPQLSSTIAR